MHDFKESSAAANWGKFDAISDRDTKMIINLDTKKIIKYGGYANEDARAEMRGKAMDNGDLKPVCGTYVVWHWDRKPQMKAFNTNFAAAMASGNPEEIVKAIRKDGIDAGKFYGSLPNGASRMVYLADYGTQSVIMDEEAGPPGPAKDMARGMLDFGAFDPTTR